MHLWLTVLSSTSQIFQYRTIYYKYILFKNYILRTRDEALYPHIKHCIGMMETSGIQVVFMVYCCFLTNYSWVHSVRCCLLISLLSGGGRAQQAASSCRLCLVLSQFLLQLNTTNNFVNLLSIKNYGLVWWRISRGRSSSTRHQYS